MVPHLYLVLAVLLLEASCSSYDNVTGLPRQSVLPRKKRYLAFSDKSAFLMTITLLKATEFDKRLNTLHEIDVPFPVPRNWFSLKYGHVHHHRRDRSLLYEHLESALQLFGVDGRSCIMKMLCEVDRLKPKLGDSLILELIKTVFSYPVGNEREVYDTALNDTCSHPCSFSLEDVIK